MKPILTIIEERQLNESEKDKVYRMAKKDIYKDRFVRAVDGFGNVRLCIRGEYQDWLEFICENIDLKPSDADMIYFMKSVKEKINRIKQLAPETFTPQKEIFSSKDLSILLDKSEKTTSEHLKKMYREMPELIVGFDPFTCSTEGVQWIIFSIRAKNYNALLEKWDSFYGFLLEQIENGQN